MRKSLVIAVVMITCALQVSAQDELCGCGPSVQDTLCHCDPRILGQPRPKGFEMTYERMVDYGIQGNRTDVNPGDYSSEVRRNARWKMKARLPLLNTPAWKVNMGLGWARETYSLESVAGGNDQVLNLLEGKELRSLSAGTNRKLRVMRVFASSGRCAYTHRPVRCSG